MALSRQALSLDSGPTGLAQARDLVTSTLHEIGRPDLLECAGIGLAELISNAVLHGEEPIQVRVGGTGTHPRVEVRDASSRPPVPHVSAPLTGPEDPLLTFGRGLHIVARAAQAWGVHREESWKTVWFIPAAGLREHGDPPAGRFTGGPTPPQARPGEPAADRVVIRFTGLPAALYTGFREHFIELRREVRLLALTHAAHYPLAGRLTGVLDGIADQVSDPVVDELDLARHPDESVRSPQAGTDVEFRLPVGAGPQLRQLAGLLDVADDFCRRHRLLALARSEEQVAFQHWFIGQCLRQLDGADPTPWTESGRPGPGPV